VPPPISNSLFCVSFLCLFSCMYICCSLLQSVAEHCCRELRVSSAPTNQQLHLFSVSLFTYVHTSSFFMYVHISSFSTYVQRTSHVSTSQQLFHKCAHLLSTFCISYLCLFSCMCICHLFSHMYKRPHMLPQNSSFSTSVRTYFQDLLSMSLFMYVYMSSLSTYVQRTSHVSTSQQLFHKCAHLLSTFCISFLCLFSCMCICHLFPHMYKGPHMLQQVSSFFTHVCAPTFYFLNLFSHTVLIHRSLLTCVHLFMCTPTLSTYPAPQLHS